MVLPRHLSSQFIGHSANNVIQSVNGGLCIQAGWVSFYGNGGKSQNVQVTFPKPFKQVLAVVPVLIGYTFQTPNSPASFTQAIGPGTNIESGAFTNTGTTIKASTSGVFGGAHHGISWIAIGVI